MIRLLSTISLCVPLLASACANHDIKPEVTTGSTWSKMPDPVTGVEKPVTALVAQVDKNGNQVGQPIPTYVAYEMVHGVKVEPGIDNVARTVTTASMFEKAMIQGTGPNGEEALVTVRQAKIGEVAAASDENSKTLGGFAGTVLHGAAVGTGAGLAGYFISKANDNAGEDGSSGAFAFAGSDAKVVTCNTGQCGR